MGQPGSSTASGPSQQHPNQSSDASAPLGPTAGDATSAAAHQVGPSLSSGTYSLPGRFFLCSGWSQPRADSSAPTAINSNSDASSAQQSQSESVSTRYGVAPYSSYSDHWRYPSSALSAGRSGELVHFCSEKLRADRGVQCKGGTCTHLHPSMSAYNALQSTVSLLSSSAQLIRRRPSLFPCNLLLQLLLLLPRALLSLQHPTSHRSLPQRRREPAGSRPRRSRRSCRRPRSPVPTVGRISYQRSNRIERTSLSSITTNR